MGYSLCLSQFLSFIFFLMHFHTTISSSFSSNYSSSAHLCAHHQSLSLLQLKQSFSINSSASSEVCQHPETGSWKEGTDCCLWDGVTCDVKTGQVTVLNLACSMLYGTLHSNNSLFSLHHLQKLDLSFNDFNSSHISSQFGQFSNLTHLSLSSSNFAGQVPSEISHLSKLVSLDLSFNEYLSLEPISFDKLVRNLTKLRELDLSFVNMSLVVPNSLMNLSSSLSSLSLSGCRLQGKFQGNIFLLPNLESLDLSYNEDLTGPFPLSNVSKVLRVLGLSSTRISVYFDSISNVKLLESMFLANCTIVRSDLPLFGNLTQLTELDLSSNNLSGKIPSSFGNLVQLRYLNLGSNNFMGEIPDFLGSLIKLFELDLSSNQFIGPIHSQICNLSNLDSLYLFDNLLNETIPSFLFALPSLHVLELHNNHFIGDISEFQYSSLESLNLRNNQLHGRLPNSIFKQENMRVLILASNSNLTGEISSFICKLKILHVLDLSNNSLSGSIPQCLGNFSNNLSVLHLGMNNFQGTISSIFSKGNGLGYLNLNGNELKGKIPLSIINCTMLEVLDLGDNKIEDNFPYFLETLPKLQVLILKSNKLHGFMKVLTTYNSFSKLRILDISNNNLSGPLPTRFFTSLEAMMAVDQNMIYMGSKNYSNYVYSMKMTWKGLEIEFVKIQSILEVLDLSNNSFTGEIPKLIGQLKGLQQLNLSHNSFIGHIQSSLGNLTNLQSLDLSSNVLTGRIPVQFADLTFLEVFNVSHNKLEGPIPSGKQFNTFDPSSFQGNLDLCGFPMPKECNSGEVPPLSPSNFIEGGDLTLFGDGFGWKAVAMGYGCGFVFGVIIGYVVFRTRKPAWFLKKVEDQWNLKARRMKKIASRNGARRN